MGALWVVAEPGADGGIARVSAEAATLARDLGASTGRDVIGIVIAADPAPAADGARHVPPGRLGDHRTRGGGARLVGRRGRPHRRLSPASPIHPTRSSSGPVPTGATSPAPSRR